MADSRRSITDRATDDEQSMNIPIMTRGSAIADQHDERIDQIVVGMTEHAGMESSVQPHNDDTLHSNVLCRL